MLLRMPLRLPVARRAAVRVGKAKGGKAAAGAQGRPAAIGRRKASAVMGLAAVSRPTPRVIRDPKERASGSLTLAPNSEGSFRANPARSLSQRSARPPRGVWR